MNKPLNNPVSDKDRAQFKGFMLKWQQLLNMCDWRITLLPDPATKNMAEVVKRDLGQRLATYRLGRSFGKGTAVNAVSLEETAIHELLHIFLFPLIEAAKAGAAEEDLETLEHSIINTLERLLMKVQDDPRNNL